MELSSSREAVSYAAARKIPKILWNLKIHYRVHKSAALVPILSHVNPVHITPSYLSEIHFNIIHPPTSWSTSPNVFSFGFYRQRFVCVLVSLMCPLKEHRDS
jgi:hypothetical protein